MVALGPMFPEAQLSLGAVTILVPGTPPVHPARGSDDCRWCFPNPVGGRPRLLELREEAVIRPSPTRASGRSGNATRGLHPSGLAPWSGSRVQGSAPAN